MIMLSGLNAIHSVRLNGAGRICKYCVFSGTSCNYYIRDKLLLCVVVCWMECALFVAPDRIRTILRIAIAVKFLPIIRWARSSCK